ncbi:MAG: hypothetical protein ABH831_02125 [Candidatus Nealsonbacteria bacterium]
MPEEENTNPYQNQPSQNPRNTDPEPEENTNPYQNQPNQNSRKIDPEPEEEKKEFLGREEVNTMEKDLSKLREKVAGEERKRISSLNEKERIIELETKKPTEKSEESEKLESPEKTPENLMLKDPKRISSFQKLLVRAVAVFLVLATGGFIYWLVTEKIPNQKPPTTDDVVIQPEDQFPPEKTELVIPESLILAEATQTIEIASMEELPEAISQYLETPQTEQLSRILIKDTANNKILGLEEFFSAFEVDSPEGFLERLDNDFTLFDQFKEGRHRLGFITNIKETANLNNIMRGWEPTLEEDQGMIFRTLGQTKGAISSYFRQINFEGIPFRFLTISREDFGICHTMYGNYFIWTTSFAGMHEVLTQLSSNE